MANTNRGSTPANLDSLVRHIIEHLDFKQAVNSASSSGVTPSSSGSSGIAASSSSGITSATAASGVRCNSLAPCQSVNSRTPREELRQIFHRRNASAPLNLRVGQTGSLRRLDVAASLAVVEVNEASPHREGKENMLSPAHSQEKLFY